MKVVEIEMESQTLATQILDVSTLGQSPDTKLHKALSEVKSIVRAPPSMKSPSSGGGFVTERSAAKKDTLIDATLGLRLKLSPKIEPKFNAKLKNKVEQAQTERTSIINFEAQIEKLTSLKKSEVYPVLTKETTRDSIIFSKQ